MLKYPWAVNFLKLERATKVAPPDDEAEIQKIYISLGGKVVGPIIQPKVENDENNQAPAKVIKEPKAK